MPRARASVIGFLALIGVAIGAALARPPEWLLETLATRFPGCLYRMPVTAPVVALTLDDGPDSSSTPLILDELERYRARATFFLISGRVAGREAIVHRIVDSGHELGNHFTSDRPSIRLGADEFAADLDSAHRVLSRFDSVRWARPGSGWYSKPMVDVMARAGYRCALGSVYPYDAAIGSVGLSTWYILRNTRPGSIIVLHDAGSRGRRTTRILAAVLPELRRRGFDIVTLSELDRLGAIQ